MADTVFTDGSTVIFSSWLNDVDKTVYEALGAGGVAPTTAAQVVANIGAATNTSVAAAISALTQFVSTIAALRAANAATLPGALVQTLGYYASNDGGGGTYVYNSLDTTSNDYGGNIIVDASGRRWYLQAQDNRITARQWGCYGNEGTLGASANDDTLQLQAAFDWLVLGKQAVYLPTGSTSLRSSVIGELDLEHLSYHTQLTLGVNTGPVFVPGGSVPYPTPFNAVAGGSGLTYTMPTITNGVVATGAVTILNGGTGYTPSQTAQPCGVFSRAGTGCTATYTTNSNGVVTAINVTAGGTGFQYGSLSLGEDTLNSLGVTLGNQTGQWNLVGIGSQETSPQVTANPAGARIIFYGGGSLQAIDAVVRLAAQPHRLFFIDKITFGCDIYASSITASSARRAFWFDGTFFSQGRVTNCNSGGNFDCAVGYNGKRIAAQNGANGEFTEWRNNNFSGKYCWASSNGNGEGQGVNPFWVNSGGNPLGGVPNLTLTITTSTGDGTADIRPIIEYYNSTVGASNGVYGQVTGYQILNPGWGYTAGDAVAYNTNGGPGSGAAATVTVNAHGQITGFTISNAGANYQGPATFLKIGGGSGAAWGWTMINHNASVSPNPSNSTHDWPVVFLDNRGSSNPIHIKGGRNENYTTLLNNSGAVSAGPPIDFDSIDMAAMGYSKQNPFIISAYNSGAPGYRINIHNCQMGPPTDTWGDMYAIPYINLYQASDVIKIDRGTFGSKMRSLFVGTGSLNQIEEVDSANQVYNAAGSATGGKNTCNYHFNTESDGNLMKRSDQYPQVRAHRGALTNMLGNPEFFLSTVDGGAASGTTVSAPVPWANYGTTLTCTWNYLGGADSAYLGYSSGVAITLSAKSGVYQDLGGFNNVTASGGVQVFYQCLCTSVSAPIKYSLEDLTTGLVYDEVVFPTSPSGTLTYPVSFTLKAAPVYSTGVTDPGALTIVPQTPSGAVMPTITVPAISAGVLTTGALTVANAGGGFASCTSGSVSGTTLTIGGTIYGPFLPGLTVNGTGIGASSVITGILSGTPTSVGSTFSLNVSSSATGNIAITSTGPLEFLTYSGFAAGTGAIGTYTTSSTGTVASATISNGGSGYNNQTGDLGLRIYNVSNIAATARIITQFVGVDKNSSFKLPPPVTTAINGNVAVLTAPGGTGTPAFSYQLNPAGGFAYVYILNGGTGGLANGNLTISQGAGTGSAAVIPYTVTSGIVTAIGSITGGSGYVGPGCWSPNNSQAETHIWGTNADSLRVHDRLEIPYKHNQFSPGGPGAVTTIQNCKADVFVSKNETTAILGERLSYVCGASDPAGAKTWQVPRGYYGSGVPGSGTWAVGDIVWNTVPAAGGATYIGWVCTTAGAIGGGCVFKGFGLIQA